MAAGIILAPGSKYGPCEKPCSHMDCMSQRWAAESICRICGKEIGYGIAFYHEREGVVHAACLETELERR